MYTVLDRAWKKPIRAPPALPRALLVPDDSLAKIIIDDSSVIRDKYRHLTICLRMMALQRFCITYFLLPVKVQTWNLIELTLLLSRKSVLRRSDRRCNSADVSSIPCHVVVAHGGREK